MEDCPTYTLMQNNHHPGYFVYDLFHTITITVYGMTNSKVLYIN